MSKPIVNVKEKRLCKQEMQFGFRGSGNLNEGIFLEIWILNTNACDSFHPFPYVVKIDFVALG